MADSKLTQLSELTAPVDSDVLYIVDDPAGTPAEKKIQVANLCGTVIENVLHNETLSVAGQFDVQNISQDYDMLELYLFVKGTDVAAVWSNWYANTDTTAANYSQVRNDGGFGYVGTQNQGTNQFVTVEGTGGAAWFSTVHVRIPDYVGSQHKLVMVDSAWTQASDTRLYRGTGWSLWENTAAINRLRFYTAAADTNFLAGSRLLMIGKKFNI